MLAYEWQLIMKHVISWKKLDLDLKVMDPYQFIGSCLDNSLQWGWSPTPDLTLGSEVVVRNGVSRTASPVTCWIQKSLHIFYVLNHNGFSERSHFRSCMCTSTICDVCREAMWWPMWRCPFESLLTSALVSDNVLGELCVSYSTHIGP